MVVGLVSTVNSGGDSTRGWKRRFLHRQRRIVQPLPLPPPHVAEPLPDKVIVQTHQDFVSIFFFSFFLLFSSFSSSFFFFDAFFNFNLFVLPSYPLSNVSISLPCVNFIPTIIIPSRIPLVSLVVQSIRSSVVRRN